jgi:hypothetical protein
MTPKGRFWNTRRAWGTAQDIEDLRRAASGQRETGPYAESVKAFRDIAHRLDQVVIAAREEASSNG